MDYEEIIEAIRQAGGGPSRDTAARATQATPQTLAERLLRGEARYIIQELPAELKPFIYTETDAEALHIDEFLSRVAGREGTDVETALRHARAVFAALGRALSPEAVEHLAAALPQTYEPLVAEAQFRYLEIMPADQFWDRQPLGLGRAKARQVTEAVLETQAERIAAGQVEDLIAQLDPLLRQGMASATPGARHMSLEASCGRSRRGRAPGPTRRPCSARCSSTPGPSSARCPRWSAAGSGSTSLLSCPRITRPSCRPASPDPAVRGRWWVAGQTVKQLWPSEHLERLRVKGRRELRVQGGQVIAIQLDVERRAVLLHRIRPAGPRDRADAVLA